jgi:hypothetical protein
LLFSQIYTNIKAEINRAVRKLLEKKYKLKERKKDGLLKSIEKGVLYQRKSKAFLLVKT